MRNDDNITHHSRFYLMYTHHDRVPGNKAEKKGSARWGRRTAQMS